MNKTKQKKKEGKNTSKIYIRAIRSSQTQLWKKIKYKDEYKKQRLDMKKKKNYLIKGLKDPTTCFTVLPKFFALSVIEV